MHRTELFLDDLMTDMRAGVTRKIQRPDFHRLNPVLRPERKWEGMFTRPGCVLYDKEEKLFKMWYWTGTVQKGDVVDGHVILSAFAVSGDGVNWRRPELDIYKLKGMEGNNIVLMSSGNNENQGLDNGKKAWIYTVMRHPNPADEREKYIALCHDQKKRGAYIARSPDGLRWTVEPEPFWRTPVDAAKWGDDNLMCMVWDAENKLWRIYRRLNPMENHRFEAVPADRDWPPPDRSVRIIGCAESRDLKKAENFRIILSPDGDDPADVEFYQMSCTKYDAGAYIGYLSVYHMSPERENIDTQLVFSRDGVSFSRCCRREAFIQSGQRNSYNYSVLAEYQPEPVIVNDIVHIYFAGSNAMHLGEDIRRPHTMMSAGLATLPRDRFARMETGVPKPCRLVTKPFALQYPKLFLNAATWGGGSIETEILSADWKVIDGFSAAECAPVRGNALAHPVSWKNNKNLAKLTGRGIRLKFNMADAALFSWTQDEEDRPLRALPDLAGPDEHCACPALW